MPRLTIRIEFENGRALGPGKVRLLELIEKVGSIRGAAIAMEMSYRRAWLLVHEIEGMMSATVIAAETGGSKGGGTRLTKGGREVVAMYRSLEACVAQSAQKEVRALSRMTRSNVRPLPHRGPRRVLRHTKKST